MGLRTVPYPWTRAACITARLGIVLLSVLVPVVVLGQGGDAQVRAQADALFGEGEYLKALPHYSQLVSLEPSDRTLNYRFGACLLYGGEDKDKAIGHLKFATGDPSTPVEAWFWLGRAYHLSYRFREAQEAYQHFKGVADRKSLADHPVDALEVQCRNGQRLLSNLKEITVRSKVEVEGSDFFRYYDLSDIGGRIVVTPDELKSTLDKKNKMQSLVYLPGKGGPIYFSSYGKDGRTGLDIYTTELLPDGRFATPTKLAGFINTDQDDDYPFMHPDGKTFYFSSKGHNSMGGYDVFKAVFDKGLYTFGRPENLDFAVNTPDDDVFYMVDAEHKEACFASGRSSRQDKLHVYRVATERMPLVITVLKGTYSSEFDPNDRKARIIVEDATTREQVADVRTDINGTYVLALPRTGRFRFMVECGPSGKTHVGMVDVPRSDEPRGYRQELSLVRHGDLEKLMIRNYFDSPLDDDLIALAMDEIRRRARLDVSEERVVAQKPPEVVEPAGDIMTQAGFSGDISKAEALRMAQEDARELEQQVTALRGQRSEAYALAIDAVEEAERTARLSQDMVDAAAKAPDEVTSNEHMLEAARARQRSREANMRARAAQLSALDLEEEELYVRQRSIAAAKLAVDLGATLNSGRDQDALRHLVALKERIDSKSGPNARPDIAEAARRAVTEQERIASRALSQAHAKRTEESELTDRINRLERERDGTGNKGKKEDLDKEIAGYKEQLGHLRTETMAALAKASALEQETAVLRGKASLIRHLSTSPGTGAEGIPTSEQVASLAMRITGNDSRIEDLPIDERYDAMIAENENEVASRTFDWELASASEMGASEITATQTMDRNQQGDARQSSTRSTDVQRSEPEGSRPQDRAVTVVPVSTEPSGVGNGRNADEALTINDPLATTAGQETRRSEQTTDPKTSGQAEGPGERSGEPTPVDPIGQQAAVVPSDEGQALTPEQVRNAELVVQEKEGQGPAKNAVDPDDPFLLENELAEARQLAAAERNRSRRDSLETRIVELEERLAAAEEEQRLAAQAMEDPTADLRRETGISRGEVPDNSRVPLVFDRNIEDEEIQKQLFNDYEIDHERLMSIPDADHRAAGLHGLELMMADSVRAEMTRQVAVLELDPQQAEVVLPRLDRLRKLRESHLQMADRVLENRRAELAALATKATATEETPRTSTGTRDGWVPGAPSDAIDDRYVAFAPLREGVYESELKHRSRKVDDALALKEKDLAVIDSLTRTIDSMDVVLSNMPPGREREQMQRGVDRLRDDRMITRTDLGQRSAYLTKQELAVANDSLKRLERGPTRQAISPGDPLVLMANGMKEEALRRTELAKEHRQKADRSDDIVERDSLYRSAYAMELLALRDLDRSITVNNYLVGGQHVPGEVLTYKEVAARVLGSSTVEPALADHVGAPAEGSGTEQVIERATLADPLSARKETTNLAPDRDASPGNAIVPVPAVQTTDPANEAVLQTAQRDALEEARVAESKLDAAAKAPVKRFDAYLANESTTLSIDRTALEDDPKLLAELAERTAREADRLEQEAWDLSAQAAEQEKQAATAKRRERLELEQLAVVNRQASDSISKAAVLKNEESRVAMEKQRAAEQAQTLRDRLLKYYYLTNEEEALVLYNPDDSRYFQARSRALEQYDAADEATSSALANRALSAALLNESANVTAGASGSASPAAMERSRILAERAMVLEAKADSLDIVADRLRGAASLNEAQASVMLQGLSEEDSSRLMALEMGARRSEILLAESRGQAGEQRPVTRVAAATGDVARIDPAGSRAVPDGPTDNNVTDRSAVATVIPARIPDVLMRDIFQLRPEDTRTAKPIPIDVDKPQGIVFMVQIGAFRNQIPESTFSDMSPVMGERLENGLTRYTAGLFTQFGTATEARDQVRDRGYRDAFVVAYRDGVRISIADARRASAEGGEVAARVERPITTVEEGSNTTQGRPDRPVTTEVPTEAPQVRNDVPAAIERPVVQPPTPEQETEAVLASYPKSAQEIRAAHAPPPEATTYYNVPGAAPARQVETINGLFFTVQVGVYSNPVALDKLFNIDPLNSELTETRKIRYTTGIFLSEERARTRRDETVSLGVKDAFITAYLNGERIPMRDARALLERYGSDVLAKP